MHMEARGEYQVPCCITLSYILKTASPKFGGRMTANPSLQHLLSLAPTMLGLQMSKTYSGPYVCAASVTKPSPQANEVHFEGQILDI